MKSDGRNRPPALGGDLPNGLVLYPKSSGDPTSPVVEGTAHKGRKKLL